MSIQKRLQGVGLRIKNEYGKVDSGFSQFNTLFGIGNGERIYAQLNKTSHKRKGGTAVGLRFYNRDHLGLRLQLLSENLIIVLQMSQMKSKCIQVAVLRFFLFLI